MDYKYEELAEAVKAAETTKANTETLNKAKELGINIEDFKTATEEKEEEKKQSEDENLKQEEISEEETAEESSSEKKKVETKESNDATSAKAIAEAVANALKEITTNKEETKVETPKVLL